MAYTYSFFDNQVAGAEELNRWVSLFVSQGIADNFQDGVPYSLSKLNDMVRNNCSEGVVAQSNNALKVTLSGETVEIQPGLAFFKDGSVMEITETERLTAEPDTKQFVYLKSDVSKNKAYPVVSDKWDTENTVLLAEISAEGILTDRRVYAKGKVPSFYASDALLPGYTEFVIDHKGDYLLSRGANTYTNLFFVGRQPPLNSNDLESPALVLYHMDLMSKETEGMGMNVDSLAYHSAMYNDNDAWWQKNQEGKMLLFKQSYGGKMYKVQAEVTQKEGNLYLTVSYIGTAADNQYIPNKKGMPMYCKVFLM